MALNPYVGWGVSTLLLWFLNKGSNSSSETDYEPEELSITETKTGTPIPVVMGRTLIKSPLVIYYGDFRADPYTETYAAHANFSAWPIILTMLLEWATAPKTGKSVDSIEGHKEDKHTHSGLYVTGQATLHGQNEKSGEHAHIIKEEKGPNYLMALAQWLLMWLINGRNLKTTMQKGFKYHLGYQMLAAWSGPGMRLRAVYLGQNKVWEGDVSRESIGDGPLVIPINNDELFGGPDESGGFVGEMHIYLGGDTQQADPWMVGQMKADSIQEELRGLTPAYRPFVSVVVPTAYVGKQATIPETWLELQMCPNSLTLGQIGEDANPAELLYEMHINKEWGLCENPELLDVDSLMAVGKKLKEENLGTTIKLEQNKSAAREIYNSICEHVNMVRYVDPRTGKLTFKLIRDDYDAASVPVLNEKNCTKVTLTRLDWRETVGEISVVYTDRQAQYEQSSVLFNDPANVEINDGAKTTKTYDYPYFTLAENALWAAKRESLQQGYPLASVSIEGNRQLSNIRIGEVICLNWPPYGIKNMLLRVTDVDIGDFVDGVVTIEALEDVFGLAKTEFGYSGSGDWTKEPVSPTGVQIYRFMELSWELMQALDSYVFAMAARPDEKTQKWTVWRQREGANWESTNSMTNWTAAGRLVYDYVEDTDAEDVVGFEIASLGGLDKLRGSVLAGGSPDIVSARRGAKVLVVGDELMAWSSLVELPNGHWWVQGILRGVHDTVPAAHTAGDTVFFLDSGTYANVTTGGPVITAGNTTTEAYNITTATVDKEEEMDYTKARTLTTVRRPERPNPPGRIRMSDGRAEDDGRISVVVGDLVMSWTTRNKRFSYGCVSQEDIIEYFTGVPFEQPDGSDFLIKVFVAGNLVASHATEQSPWTYTWAQRCLDSQNLTDTTRLEIYTRANGLESYQPQHRTFSWAIPAIVDGVETDEAALATLAAWGAADRIVVPAGPLATEQQYFYADRPVFVLGAAVASQVPGAIARQDGSWLYPDGRLLIVSGQTDVEVVAMDTGYTLASAYVPEASGGKIFYRWDGTKFVQTEIGGA